MPCTEYSLPDILERIYENQPALEAALMELTPLVEIQGWTEVGDNVRGALATIGENAGHIKQGLARITHNGKIWPCQISCLENPDVFNEGRSGRAHWLSKAEC